MNDRVAREREFHDTRFAHDHGPRPADRFYVVNRAANAYTQAILAAAPAGARVLEIGCGDGAYAARQAAARGLAVSAVDLSPVAIEHARERAAHEGTAERIEFAVMNAEQLDLPADSFDLVCGTGVLHHLDLEAALKEVGRVCRPGGVAAFVEPLAHNPVLRLYRRGTPTQRSADEQPLRGEDLDTVRGRFAEVELSYFSMLTPLALPLAGRAAFEPALRRLEALDRLAFRTPLRAWAWMVGMRLRGARGA